MEWLKNATIIIVSIILLYHLFFIINVSSKIEIRSSDNMSWLEEYNDISKNLNEPNWITYNRTFDRGGTVISDIINIPSGRLDLRWKLNETDKIGNFAKVNFLLNGKPLASGQSKDYLTRQIELRNGDVLQLITWFRDDGNKLWIGFLQPQIAANNDHPQSNVTQPQSNVTQPQSNVTQPQSNVTQPQIEIHWKIKELNNSDKYNLQKMIDECDDYTRLMLLCQEYIINDTLIIKSKHNLEIISDGTLSKPDIRFFKDMKKILIKIDNSDHIRLNNLSINASGTGGIIFKRSNNCKIINNRINISCNGTGIYLESGDGNFIESNEINGVNGSDGPCVGIQILDAINTYIAENEIHANLHQGSTPIERAKRICHYHIRNKKPLNTTIVIPDFDDGRIELRWGDCSSTWSAGYFSNKHIEGTQKEPCEILDNNISSYVWNY